MDYTAVHLNVPTIFQIVQLVSEHSSEWAQRPKLRKVPKTHNVVQIQLIHGAVINESGQAPLRCNKLRMVATYYFQYVTLVIF